MLHHNDEYIKLALFLYAQRCLVVARLTCASFFQRFKEAKFVHVYKVVLFVIFFYFLALFLIASVNMSSAGEYHIILNGSLVNNCIIHNVLYNF
jgi:hypothetical protein